MELDTIEEFRRNGKSVIDFIADYFTTLHMDEVPPLSEVPPGYLRSYIPHEPPEESEDWQTIMEDVEDAILPGVPINIILVTINYFIAVYRSIVLVTTRRMLIYISSNSLYINNFFFNLIK